MRVGLYSITYLGIWYDGPALSIEEIVVRAKRFGYDGIEIDGKRPHGNPADCPQRRCHELRDRASDAGVPVYAVAANNDFSSPIPEFRESQLLYVRDLIRMTADLGAPVLRVFAAWPGVTMDGETATYLEARRVWRETQRESTPGQIWDRCRAGLTEAAQWAGEHGVTLALQNHPPVTNTPDDMVRMIREVASPNLKACLDAPLAAKQGISAMLDTARSVPGLQALSHYGGEYQRRPDGSVVGNVRDPNDELTPEDYYADFAQGMRDIGYDGYIGYELCHPLPKGSGLDFADLNAQLAAAYMRAIVTYPPTAAGD
jgi:sugar phosphate isomerase/epimerase